MLMAVMMTPRETWTDERLDDLNKKVDKGFADVDAHFDRFEKNVAEGFAKVDNDVRELRRMMFQGFFALAAIQATGFAALVAAAIF
jgi:hypothetical protein